MFFSYTINICAIHLRPHLTSDVGQHHTFVVSYHKLEGELHYKTNFNDVWPSAIQTHTDYTLLLAAVDRTR